MQFNYLLDKKTTGRIKLQLMLIKHACCNVTKIYKIIEDKIYSKRTDELFIKDAEWLLASLKDKAQLKLKF